MRARALRSGCGVNPRDVVQHTRTGNPLVDSVAEHQPASAQAWHAPQPDGLSCHSRHRRIPYWPVIP
jgi:hypothetical protein